MDTEGSQKYILFKDWNLPKIPKLMSNQLHVETVKNEDISHT